MKKESIPRIHDLAPRDKECATWLEESVAKCLKLQHASENWRTCTYRIARHICTQKLSKPRTRNNTSQRAHRNRQETRARNSSTFNLFNQQGAVHIYQKCGFKDDGRLKNGIKFLDGTYADEIIMELLLKHLWNITYSFPEFSHNFSAKPKAQKS